MPYIKEEDRIRLEDNPNDITTAGELNYLVFKHAKSRFTNYQSLNDIIADIEEAIYYHQNAQLCWAYINPVYSISRNALISNKAFISNKACIGALRCCELEIYRRLAAPYEDLKIEENGDVK